MLHRQMVLVINHRTLRSYQLNTMNREKISKSSLHSVVTATGQVQSQQWCWSVFRGCLHRNHSHKPSTTTIMTLLQFQRLHTIFIYSASKWRCINKQENMKWNSLIFSAGSPRNSQFEFCMSFLRSQPAVGCANKLANLPRIVQMLRFRSRSE